jgi:hypothetical protein
MRSTFVLVILSLSLVWPFTGLADSNATNPHSEYDALAAKLASTDDAEKHEAIRRIRQLVADDPAAMAGVLQRTLLRPMIAARLYDEAADLALQGILAAPSSTSTVEALLTHRVRALLAAGKASEALAEAKSLFNVSTMAGTGQAILLVGEALRAAYPDDPDLARRFRAEQVTGASAMQKDRVESAVLKDIQVNPRYAAAVPPHAPEEYNALVARGNLLLLADRPDAAQVDFEVAYELADARALVPATENLARVIKATDGTINGANAFVRSLRTPTPNP